MRSRLRATVFGFVISLGSMPAAACTVGHYEFDLRHYINNPVAILEVRAMGQIPHPERPDYQIANVRIENVLRGPELPNGRTTNASVIFQQHETRGPSFERARRYVVGVWLFSNSSEIYLDELTVYGGGGSCIGQMIYRHNSTLGAALSMVFDGEGDQDTEREILNTYLQSSSGRDDRALAAITMLFDGEGDQAQEYEILHTFEQRTR